MLLVTPAHGALMCGMLGVPADSEYGESALMEIGNIVGSSYINALAMMTGMELEPTPPAIAVPEPEPLPTPKTVPEMLLPAEGPPPS